MEYNKPFDSISNDLEEEKYLQNITEIKMNKS